MKKPWGTTVVVLVVVEAISSCSITQATMSPLASDIIAAVVDDGDSGSHHSKDRAEEERKESSGKDLQHQQQLQLKNNKLMGFFLQEAEMDEGDASYSASIRKTAATNARFSGDEVLKESHDYYFKPSSSSNKATRRTENDRELQRYHDGYDVTTSSTETPTASPSSAPTTTTTSVSSAPTLSITTTASAHRSNNGYSFPKAHPSPSTIIADSRDAIEFLTGAPTTTMTIRGAAAEATTSSPQTTAVGGGITETGSSSSSSPSSPTAPPSTLVSLEEPREVDGAPRSLLPTWGLSSTAAATVVVVAAVVLAGFPFTEIIV